MKRIVSLLIAVICFYPLFSQSAKEALDKTAAKIANSGCLKVSFTTTFYNGLKPNGNTNGTLLLKGNKFKLSSREVSVWYDGKTEWSLVAGNNEVNVSTPSVSEAAMMNPYTFTNLYKKDYNTSIKDTKYAGKPCKDVALQAQNKSNQIQRMLVIVDANYIPVNIRIKNKQGNWIRFAITEFKANQKVNNSTFRFNPKDFPNIEIIDLR